MSKQRGTTSAAAHAAGAAQQQYDADARLAAQARKLFRLVTQQRATWKTCKLTDCRRQRACTARDFQCRNLPPVPKLTPEERAAAITQLKRAAWRPLSETRRQLAE